MWIAILVMQYLLPECLLNAETIASQEPASPNRYAKVGFPVSSAIY